MLKKLLQKFLIKAKGIEYNIDPRITNSYLLKLIFVKLISLLRGILRLRKPVFLGRNIKLDAAHLISIGKSSSLGDYSQIDALSSHGIHIGKGVSLGRFGKVRATATLNELGYGVTLGDYVGIGDGYYLGAFGGIAIGSDTIIGERFTVHSDNHLFDNPELPIRAQGVVAKPVKIGRNCWFGSNVTVLGGVDIGDGCIVGAGAVVTKSFPENSIIVGNPAKLINKRIKE